MTGVAQAADSIGDLASFLGGEPDEAHKDEDQAETPEGEQDEELEGDEESEGDESEDNPDEPASRKIKVTVKGEDGTDSTEEVDESELVSGYMRQKAFTQKTMELSTKERQATEIVQQRVTEASQYSMQQAQAARSMVIELAGLANEQELQRLAQSDPAAWVQEQERARYVQGRIAQLDASIKADQERIAQVAKDQEAAQSAATWEVLNAKGINRQKLTDLYAAVGKDYGITQAQLGKVLEPGLVLALKDAAAYRALQAAKPNVSQKVKSAERLPTSKQALPASERVNKQLGEKFSRGRAKVNDLASFLHNNRM